MNRKWSSEKVRETQRWLEKRWPEFFMPGPDLQPLTVKAHKEILKYREEFPAMSGRVLEEVLKRHTSSYGYLYGLLKNTHRSDLNGNKVELVSAEHRRLARSTLRSMHKTTQKDRQSGLLGTCGVHTSLAGQPDATTLDRDVRLTHRRKVRSPVIRYKRAKRTVLPVDLTPALVS